MKVENMYSKVYLNLELETKEIEFLQEITQNPYGDISPEEEDENHKNIRTAIFSACQQALSKLEKNKEN